MIARIWHGWTRPEDADGYEAHLRPELLPGLSAMKGYKGSFLLRRQATDEVEFVTMILWESPEDLQAVAGANYEAAIIPEDRKKYLSRFEAKAAHYEVVEAKMVTESQSAPKKAGKAEQRKGQKKRQR